MLASVACDGNAVSRDRARLRCRCRAPRTRRANIGECPRLRARALQPATARRTMGPVIRPAAAGTRSARLRQRAGRAAHPRRRGCQRAATPWPSARRLERRHAAMFERRRSPVRSNFGQFRQRVIVGDRAAARRPSPRRRAFAPEGVRKPAGARPSGRRARDARAPDPPAAASVASASVVGPSWAVRRPPPRTRVAHQRGATRFARVLTAWPNSSILDSRSATAARLAVGRRLEVREDRCRRQPSTGVVASPGVRGVRTNQVSGRRRREHQRIAGEMRVERRKQCRGPAGSRSPTLSWSMTSSRPATNVTGSAAST